MTISSMATKNQIRTAIPEPANTGPPYYTWKPSGVDICILEYRIYAVQAERSFIPVYEAEFRVGILHSQPTMIGVISF